MNTEVQGELREMNLQFHALTASVFGLVLQISVDDPRRSSHLHIKQFLIFPQDVSNKTLH
jgi:hypothetical protein